MNGTVRQGTCRISLVLHPWRRCWGHDDNDGDNDDDDNDDDNDNYDYNDEDDNDDDDDDDDDDDEDGDGDGWERLKVIIGKRAGLPLPHFALSPLPRQLPGEC